MRESLLFIVSVLAGSAAAMLGWILMGHWLDWRNGQK